MLEAADPAGPTFGDERAVLNRLRAASPFVRGGSLADSGDVVHPIPFDQLGSAPPSDWNAELGQHALDGGAADAVFASQLLARSAGQITLDELVSVRKFDFEGHVYDLETRQGWLAADNILASNCRCRLTAVREARAQQLGIRSGAEIRNLPDEGFEPGVLIGPDLLGLLSGGE
jgi:hypothetical protein